MERTRISSPRSFSSSSAFFKEAKIEQSASKFGHLELRSVTLGDPQTDKKRFVSAKVAVVKGIFSLRNLEEFGECLEGRNGTIDQDQGQSFELIRLLVSTATT